MTMPENNRTDKQRKRLIKLLESLFQLDQPDLDFGFYKIMHAKAGSVSNFLEKDLLKVIQDAFGEADEARVENAKATYEKTRQDAQDLGAPNPDEAPKVKEAKAAYDAAKDSGANEGEIYEHLYRFFERYYDNGDFMSRRYYARETGGKAAPYAVPYDGREVYLHWANRDQYYIKTSEYLTNFTFDLANAQELQGGIFKQESLKLHCRIVEAAEGEHNNNKSTDSTTRFFVLHEQEPVKIEDGDLVLQFEYKPLPNKKYPITEDREKELKDTYKTSNKGDMPILDMADKILHAIPEEQISYKEALATIVETEKTKKRPLLAKYLTKYTKRNTTDYFIHKDLGSFLKRELDFYIKNEIMRLDDIESADAPQVQAYLDKIKVLRKIAGQLIAFLAQLEEFQKKLWLKKKFVTETQYCITLDRIPQEMQEHMYAEIAANDAQRKEWVSLFAIDELDGYSEPLSIDFLKASPFLVLDTAFFTSGFKDALMAGIQDFDESLNGLLIHSENFQALGLMQDKYKGQVKCIYIDPPYNTGPTEIIYKNAYKDSSWLSLMANRISKSLNLLNKSACYAIAIDDYEMSHLCEISDFIFQNYDRQMIVVNHHPQGGMSNNISRTHEYMLIMVPSGQDILKGKAKSGDIEYRSFMLSGPGSNKSREGRPNSFYAILLDENNQKIVGIENPPPIGVEYSLNKTKEGYVRRYPISPSGDEKVWCRSYESAKECIQSGEIIISDNGILKLAVNTKGKRFNLMSNWCDSKYNAGPHGTALVADIIGSRDAFSYPKSIHTVVDSVEAMTWKQQKVLILDYFAGSGTTGHAVVNLNREDDGKRKYIMVEMGNYFDAVTRPRMQKVVYSQDWKDGKPVSCDGISHAFKYIRLESYEDTLNNLSFKDDDQAKARQQAINHPDNKNFKRDYMLKYWLEFETKGSPSLLNIEQFDDPTGYKLTLKKPGSDEYEEKSVDLVESFNWLIGLHVDHLDRWRSYGASFKREPDPELPGDDTTRLILDGRMNETVDGKWPFRKVEGRVCRTPGDMNNTDRVLVIWRKLTGNLEEDNLMLDAWFNHHYPLVEQRQFDIIYINGSNNLQQLCDDGEQWQTRLIEEAFHQQMWDVGK